MVFAVREPTTARARRPARAACCGASRRGRARPARLRPSRGRSTSRVRDRIVAETRGNPLALLELPRGMTRRSSPADSGSPRAAAAGHIEQSFIRRLASCPRRRSGCCCWRPPSRWATPRCSGAPPSPRDRRERGRAREDARAARARSARPLPASAGALGGLPRGVRRPSGARASGAGRGDRSGARPRSPGVASRAGGGRRRRGGRRRARALGRPRAGPRRRCGGGGVPGAGGGADARSGGAGRRALAAAQAKFEAGRPGRGARAARDRRAHARSTSSSAPGCTAARRDRVRPQRGSDAPPLLLDAARRLEPLDPDSRATRTWTRSAAAMFAGRLATRRRREVARGGAHRAPGPQPPARSTCSSTAWRRGSPMATRPASSARTRSKRSATRGTDGDRTCAGSGWPAGSRRTSGRTRSGTSSPTPGCGSPASRRAQCSRGRHYRAGVHIHAGEFADGVGADRGGRAITQAPGRRAAPTRPSCWPPSGATRPKRRRCSARGARSATRAGEGWRVDRSVVPRCSTTVSAATTTRSRPRSGRARTTTSRCTAGRSSS